jgi:3-hydroxymyristoyl/3-hydroxydecanoyl-(acyl carrier protein) dehydratase
LSKLIKTQPQQLSCERIEQGYQFDLLVPADLDYFNGHFKDGPILAGVVQLDWAIAAICQQFNLARPVQNVEVLKFQVVITPGMTISLTVEQKSADKYLFSYHSAKGQHASGRVVFASNN